MWRRYSEPPLLGSQDIHVWQARIKEHSHRETILTSFLSEAEHQRAHRFKQHTDYARYVVSHGILRTVLGKYTATNPERVTFMIGPHGKPSLVQPRGAESLQFNLSHSGGLMLVGVAHQRIGVDVESCAPVPECEELAARFFSPAEQAEFRSLPTREKLAGFFSAWTRKEAYIKATGLGISRGLDYFDVSLTPGRAARLLCDRHAHDRGARWSMHNLVPAPNYFAALAVEHCLSDPQLFIVEPGVNSQ